MASIINSKSRDFKHGGIFSNHSQAVILLMKSLAKLKDRVKSRVYKMFVNEIDLRRIFDSRLISISIWQVVFSLLDESYVFLRTIKPCMSGDDI